MKGVSCKYSSYLGKGTDPCTVTLTAAAGSSGVTVTLTSSNGEAKVPASVSVPAGATGAGFSATILTGLTTLVATITASGGGGSTTFALKLAGNEYELNVSAYSLPFGDVDVKSTATQSITLKSTGKNALTISSAKVTGSASFSLKGASLPVSLAPNQTATWDVEFEPTLSGSAAGTLAILSNSDLSTVATVSLSGTGTSAANSYAVDLSWAAPSGSSAPIAGYRIYRATKGSSNYALLNSSLDTGTIYTDQSVAAGVSYDYYVESVNSAGISSAPSNVSAVSVP